MQDQALQFKVGDVSVMSAYPLPKERPSLRLLEAREEQIEIELLLESYGFFKKKLSKRHAPELGGYQYIARSVVNGKEYAETLTIRPNFDIEYQRSPEVLPPEGPALNKEQTLDLAEKFIESHGGMPKDAVLKVFVPASAAAVVGPGGKQATVGSYNLVYGSREFKGRYKIAGVNHIEVLVDGAGVASYKRFWRHPVKLTGKARQVVPAKDALKGGFDFIKTSYRPKSGQPVKMAYETTLYKMELVYLSPEPGKRVRKLRPAWEIRFLGTNHVLFVDAFSGKGLELGGEEGYGRDKEREIAANRVAELQEKLRKQAEKDRKEGRAQEQAVRVEYNWVGGKKPTFPERLPLYVRDESRMTIEELRQLSRRFETRESLPVSDGFYRFGSAKKEQLKPGLTYELELSDIERRFTYKLTDWMNWAASQEQPLPDQKASRQIAIDFLGQRGLMPPQVGKVEVTTSEAEYSQPDKRVMQAPAVWVNIQGKIDGYSTIGIQGEPDVYGWITVAVGPQGKVLTARGMLPAKQAKKMRKLIPVDEAIRELNRGSAISDADWMHNDELLLRGVDVEVGPLAGTAVVSPILYKKKITDVELAYQIRFSKPGNQYFGPVYVFTVDNRKDGSEKLTFPAAKP